MKTLSIFGIILSIIGLLISILLLAVGTNIVGYSNIFGSNSAEDAATVVFTITGLLLLINLFFFAFSVIAAVKSFKKNV